MKRIKRNLISSSLIGRRGWTCWFGRVCGRGISREIGVSFGALGMIEVGRDIFPDWSRGTVKFEAGGRFWYWTLRPCPTRLGLVRIARRLRRDVERLYEAECMLRANGRFMGRKRRAKLAEELAAMKKRLRGTAEAAKDKEG
ncbi:MAG TPA: hypothetical protein VNA25_16805 [Phycisphaerae bacterium]|nr:hypothetical protein [Phycisphaerae bacterium]